MRNLCVPHLLRVVLERSRESVMSSPTVVGIDNPVVMVANETYISPLTPYFDRRTTGDCSPINKGIVSNVKYNI